MVLNAITKQSHAKTSKFYNFELIIFSLFYFSGILIVDPQKKITSVIQNFTWGVAASTKDLFPAGLTVDPRTDCLVLNSRTGHVQFFNTRTKSLLYNVSNSLIIIVFNKFSYESEN